MFNSFINSIKDFKDTSRRNVAFKEDTTLKTKTIKYYLGVNLIFSIIIGLLWGLMSDHLTPLLIPVAVFLETGWFWNKVTDSWDEYSIINQEGPQVPSNDIVINTDDIFTGPVVIPGTTTPGKSPTNDIPNPTGIQIEVLTNSSEHPLK